MTKDEIIEMAKQSGIDIGMWEKLSDDDDVFGYSIDGTHENLEAFAKLVAEHEREVCAKIADQYVGQDLEHNFSALVAHNIRARGQE